MLCSLLIFRGFAPTFLIATAQALSSCSQAPIKPALAAQSVEQSNQIQSIYWSDGDSGRITLVTGEVVKFRLNDIDAPETGGVGAAIGGAKCEKERELGFEAKEWAVEYTRGVPVKITGDHGEDRHGRNIFDLAANDNDMGQAGIAAGVYGSWKHDGKKALEKRPVWCGG